MMDSMNISGPYVVIKYLYLEGYLIIFIYLLARDPFMTWMFFVLLLEKITRFQEARTSRGQWKAALEFGAFSLVATSRDLGAGFHNF